MGFEIGLLIVTKLEVPLKAPAVEIIPFAPKVTPEAVPVLVPLVELSSTAVVPAASLSFQYPKTLDQAGAQDEFSS